MPKRILIVDDSKAQRMIIYSRLNKNHICEEASNGKEALGKIRANVPDLVILDISMPVMDGMELLKYIRTNDNNRIQKVPVIMMTAASDEESVRGALKLGISDYIVKPVVPDRAIPKIIKILN